MKKKVTVVRVLDNYKIIRIEAGTSTWYQIKERFLWFFWRTMNDVDDDPYLGPSYDPMRFPSVEAASNFINYFIGL